SFTENTLRPNPDTVNGLASGNVYAGVKGALRAAHGTEVAEGVSDYHLALEVSGACPGLGIAVEAETWSVISGWSVGDMAKWLLGLARGANLKRYRKATRGPKKPRPPRTRFPDAKHIATSRLLHDEQTRCTERDGPGAVPAADLGRLHLRLS
ncbi:hypothetical protein R5W23_000643, partial [Gemmata sp. JC673]|nr:hypothetical protein [Gemmata algarum]